MNDIDDLPVRTAKERKIIDAHLKSLTVERCSLAEFYEANKNSPIARFIKSRRVLRRGRTQGLAMNRAKKRKNQ